MTIRLTSHGLDPSGSLWLEMTMDGTPISYMFTSELHMAQAGRVICESPKDVAHIIASLGANSSGTAITWSRVENRDIMVDPNGDQVTTVLAGPQPTLLWVRGLVGELVP